MYLSEQFHPDHLVVPVLIAVSFSLAFASVYKLADIIIKNYELQSDDDPFDYDDIIEDKEKWLKKFE